jgi:hypothetical protein
MKRFVPLGSLIIGCLLLAQTSIGNADEPAARAVQVINCVASTGSPNLTFPSIEGELQIVQPALPAMLMIAYTNRSATPINVIDFGVVKDGKVVAMVRDVGEFDTDAPIMHAFGIREDAIPVAVTPSSCIPLRIRYANGTSWMNPDVVAGHIHN